MPITLTCPHCHKSLAAPDTSIGRVVACPHCRGKLSVPAPTPPEDDFAAIGKQANEPEGNYSRRRQSHTKTSLSGAKLVALIVLAAAIAYGGWYGLIRYPSMRAAEVKHSEMLDDWEAERYGLTEESIHRSKDAFFTHYGRYPNYVKKGER